MLTSIKIKNFALIENAEIDFSGHFNVITGESGAGKSIFMDALALLAGERAAKNSIRNGAERCEVSAFLRINVPKVAEAQKFFIDNNIEYDVNSEVALRRVLTNSSSRNYINDCPVSAKTMRDFTEMFFDFNHPDDDLSLNSKNRQLELLDRFGNTDKTVYRETFTELKSALQQLNDFDTGLPTPDEIEDLSEFIRQFEALNPQDGEEEELQSKHKMLNNSKELLENSGALVNLLSSGENSLLEQMGAAVRLLQQQNHLAPESCGKYLDEADLICSKIRDLSDDLENFGESLELDGETFQQIEQRLSDIFRLKRKYGPSFAELLENYQIAKAKIDKFENSRKLRNDLQNQISDLKIRLQSEAGKITLWRKTQAEKLKNLMLAELKNIGFNRGKLDWRFNGVEPDFNGADDAEMLFCANVGEAVLPLREIASSGERSRLFLALKTVLAKFDDVSTVIFDEIDANIGGETANKVGVSLTELSKYCQIIVISHLPQIAGRANLHIGLSKHEVENRTYSVVKVLNETQRVDELARMLGGTAAAKAHAAEIFNTIKG